MKQLEPIFSDILQNAIEAIERTATPATPAPTSRQYHEPAMMTAHFFMNEFRVAEQAVYALIQIRRQEADQARNNAENYAEGTMSREHYLMIEKFKREEVANLRMATSAFYHATKRENRPR